MEASARGVHPLLSLTCSLALMASCLGWSLAAFASTSAGGLSHTCLPTGAGGLQCAGTNYFGELGNGTTISSTTPVNVSGLSSGVIDFAVGGGAGYGEFSCALTAAGAVKCWGGSYSNGSATDQTTPVTVPGLGSGVTAITAGGGHACAVLNGGVKCWGGNGFGQLGNGTTVDSATPVDVTGLGAGSGVNNIGAGNVHTCATLQIGGIKCWGNNGQGRLGNGTTTNSSTPVDVSGYTATAGSVAAGGSHTCAKDTNGALACWGDNFAGQLGDGNNLNNSTTPVNVLTLTSGVTDVVAGEQFTCAFKAGVVYCWGYNWDGELGDGTRVDKAAPNPVNALGSAAIGVVSGRNYACAGLDTGAIQCWGRNDTGQFGNGTVTARLTPTDVVGLGSGMSAIAGDRDSSCVLTSGGGVKCWGRNEFSGQLGDGTQINRLTPVDVSGLTSGVSAIAVGGRHACALTQTNGVKCWGRNVEGQVGDSTNSLRSTPVDVTGLTSGVIAIAAGFTHTCALTNTGAMKCWGQNTAGQIGDNSSTNRNAPTDVNGLGSGVTAITAGVSHSCAVVAGGAVKCWGLNDHGRLGDGTTTNSLVPVDVVGLGSGIASVGAGNYHTCARTTTNTVKCWGGGFWGQMGNGTFTDTNLAPVDVPGLAGVTQVAVGRNHTCIRTGTGGIKCWGANENGQVGDGTQNGASDGSGRSSPTDVLGLTSGVSAIGKGGFHSCAVTGAGAAKCWGFNLWGQIGDGTNLGLLLPTDSLFSLTPAAAVDLVQEPPLPVPDTSGSSGASVDAAPEIVVVGAPDSDADGVEAGQVFVYTPGDSPAAKAAFREAVRAGKSVKAIADVNLATLQMPPELANIADKLGGAVAVSHDGNTVAVGAPNQLAGRGSIFIFKKPPAGWGGKVLPSQAALLSPNPADGDGLGTSIAITNAGTIIAGAPGANSGAGVVFVIRKGDTTYTISAPIPAQNPQTGAGFGSSVSGEGSDIVVGAPNRDVAGNVDQGQVQVFREAGGVVNPTPIAVVNNPVASAGDQFGASVSLSDGALLVGAPGRDRPAAENAGAAEVFEQTADPTSVTLVPRATLVDPNADAGAALGTSVSLEGGTAIVGEPNVDIGGNLDQGGAMVYFASDSTLFTGTPLPDGQLFDPFGGAGDHYGTSVAIGDTLAVVGSPDAGIAQVNKVGGVAKPGEAIAYTDSVIFRSGMESLLGAGDGCANPGVAIPDDLQAGVTDELTLNTTGNVKNLDVRVRITHGFVSDLQVSLIHVPSGRTVLLYEPKPSASCDSNDLDVKFDDQAVDGFARDQCSAGTPAIGGRFLPNDWLTIMQGVTRAGPWRLKVADVSAAETGTLESWCVDAR